jgi:DNA-binding NarL/FixJ family response regulator
LKINFSSTLFNTLTEKQMKVVRLRLENASWRDIAEEINTCRGTVRTHYERAILKISVRLKNNNENEGLLAKKR